MSVIQFNSKSQEYNWLSNFAETPFLLDGYIWPTVEHYFQAQKFPTDFDIQHKIRTVKTPVGAKRLGRTKSEYFRNDWNEVREEVMKQALVAKFTQNEGLREKLLQTGTNPLEENASWDSYWGTGKSGKGANRMGHLLMNLRAELS